MPRREQASNRARGPVNSSSRQNAPPYEIAAPRLFVACTLNERFVCVRFHRNSDTPPETSEAAAKPMLILDHRSFSATALLYDSGSTVSCQLESITFRAFS